MNEIILGMHMCLVSHRAAVFRKDFFFVLSQHSGIKP